MGNGLAIASLVLGILGIIFGWIPFIGMIFILGGLIGLILGIIFLVKSKEDPTMTAKGMAIAGVILCGITVTFMSLISIGATAFFGVLDPEGLAPQSRIVMSSGFGATGVPIVTDNSIKAIISNNIGTDVIILSTGKFISEQCINGKISSITSAGSEINENTVIKDGDTFTITWTCEQPLRKGQIVRATFNVDYARADGGFQQSAAGSLTGVNK